MPTTQGALGSARAAILNFLAGAKPLELRPLVEAFLEPLGEVGGSSGSLLERGMSPSLLVPPVVGYGAAE